MARNFPFLEHEFIQPTFTGFMTDLITVKQRTLSGACEIHLITHDLARKIRCHEKNACELKR
jgi:hypothetical protein